MKYKNFDEWLKAWLVDNTKPGATQTVRTMMRASWDAALDNFPVNEQNAVIGHKIHELLNTMKDAMKIDCTCDKIKIKGGAPCICVRGGAIMMSTKELGAYLRKLRKELK